MAYTLSDRHNQSSGNSNKGGDDHGDDSIDFGILASICFVAGLVSLMTAWIFSFETDQVFSTNAKPSDRNGLIAQAGPITVRKFNESYHIEVSGSVGEMQYSFIEGEVLDASKQPLFTFGEEIWHETGYDDGYWREQHNDYSMDVTFPKPGSYYIRFASEGSEIPRNLKIRISKRLGSSLPHFWFGVILIIAGIILNEIRNRTITRIVEHMMEDN